MITIVLEKSRGLGSRCDTGFYNPAGDHVETGAIAIIVAVIDREVEVVSSIDLSINETGTA